MTQFKNLELIYHQFLNLNKEINSMIENEDYDSATSKLNYKNQLIKKLSQAKKTTDLTEEESQKLQAIEEQIREDEQKVIASLEKLQEEVGIELNKTKKKVKISSAYSITTKNNQGALIDISE